MDLHPFYVDPDPDPGFEIFADLDQGCEIFPDLDPGFEIMGDPDPGLYFLCQKFCFYVKRTEELCMRIKMRIRI